MLLYHTVFTRPVYCRRGRRPVWFILILSPPTRPLSTLHNRTMKRYAVCYTWIEPGEPCRTLVWWVKRLDNDSWLVDEYKFCSFCCLLGELGSGGAAVCCGWCHIFPHTSSGELSCTNYYHTMIGMQVQFFTQNWVCRMFPQKLPIMCLNLENTHVSFEYFIPWYYPSQREGEDGECPLFSLVSSDHYSSAEDSYLTELTAYTRKQFFQVH